MDTTAIVAFLGALSVASERLVEIIKGLMPSLDEKKDKPAAEARRRAALHILAAIAGCITAGLAYQAGVVPEAVSQNGWSVVALGLLASGGSGFWNSILDYVNGVKDIKKAEAEEKTAKPK